MASRFELQLLSAFVDDALDLPLERGSDTLSIMFPPIDGR